MGAGASTAGAPSTLSPDAVAAIKLLPEATQAELSSGTPSAEALATIKEALPAAVQVELEGLDIAKRISSPSIADRIAAPVFYPFRWEEAVASVCECEGGAGAKLTLPKMIELSAALLDLPKLSTIDITGESPTPYFELLSNHRAIFADEGYSERLRELLRSEKAKRLAQLASLDAKEKRAMADAVCSCCNDDHRPRVASTIGAILMGDVSSARCSMYLLASPVLSPCHLPPLTLTTPRFHSPLTLLSSYHSPLPLLFSPLLSSR